MPVDVSLLSPEQKTQYDAFRNWKKIWRSSTKIFQCREAQSYALSCLHKYLPMCPSAWISFELDKKNMKTRFLELVYLKYRRRTTLHMLLCMVLILVYGPCMYANTIMPFPCDEQNFSMHLRTENATEVTLQSVSADCTFRLKLKAFNSLVGGGSLLGALSFAAVAKLMMCINESGTFALLILSQNLLPLVFYSALGPVCSNHSGQRLLAQSEHKALKDGFSYLHDFLGTADLLILCLCTAAGTFACSVYVAYRSSGLSGASAGAAMGVVVARLVLLFLNYAIGASNSLVTFIEGELLSFQPHREVLKGNLTSVNEEYIQDEVDRTVDVLKKIAMGDQDNGTAVMELADRVEAGGKEILLDIAKWLLANRHELPFHQGSCFRLSCTKTSSFTCTEYELASLSMMKIDSFLVAYFLDAWPDLKRLGWDTEFQIREIYISYPDKVVVNCNFRKPLVGDPVHDNYTQM